MDENVVDTLKIEIVGDLGKAVDSIGKLISTLEKIKGATSGSNKGLNSIQKNLSKISEAVAKIDSGSASKLRDLADGLKGLNEVGNIRTGKTADRIVDLGVAVDLLKDVDFSKLTELANGLQALGAVGNVNVPRFDNSSAPTDNATPSAPAMDEQVFIPPSTVEETRSALNSLSADMSKNRSLWTDIANVAQGAFQKIDTALVPLKAKVAGVALAGVMQFNILKSKLTDVASAVSSKVGSAFDALKQKMQPVGNAARYVWNTITQPIQGVISTLGRVGSKFGEILSKAKAALTPIGTIAKSAFGKLGSLAGQGAKAVTKSFLKIAGAPLQKLKTSLSKATTKFRGLFTMFRKQAMYRAFSAIIHAIAAGFKEGMDNAYQYSKALGGSLASSLDSISTSFLYFKNSIGAAVAPLINMFAPAIEYVIDKCVALINVLNQVFAKLSGASTWTKVVKKQTTYAEATDSAVKSTKSLTTGIDELNILSDNGSDNSGSSGANYGSMFEEMEFDNDLATWADQFKEAISTGDWSDVGAILGKKVNEIFDAINFEEIGSKLGYGIQSAFEVVYNFLDTIDFVKIGSNIATFLNSTIEQIDFNLVGKTFAKKWTVLIDTIYGFVTTFDWSKFGLAISDFINGWFDEIDLTKAVQTAQEIILGIFEALQSAIQNVEWYKIGTQVMDSIESIDWQSLLGSLGQLISNTVIGLLDLLLATVGETDWGKVVQNILTGLGEMIANIDWGQILAKIGALIVELVVQIPGIIVGALGGISDLLGGLFRGFGLDSVAGLFHGIGEKMREAGAWLKKNLVDPVINWVKNLFGIHSPSKVFAEIGTFLVDGLWQGIKDTWHNITDFFSEKLEGIKKVCSSAWNSIKTTASTVWSNLSSSLSKTWESVKSKAGTTWGDIKTNISSTWDNISRKVDNARIKLTCNIRQSWVDIKTDTAKKWADIKTSLSDAWDNIKLIFDKISGWVYDNVIEPVSGFFTDLWSGFSDGVDTAWTNIVQTLNEISDWVYDNVVRPVSKFFSRLWDDFSTKASDAWEGVKEVFGKVGSFFKTTFENAWKGVVKVFSSGGEIFTDIKDGIVSSFKSIVNGLIKGLNKVVSVPFKGINTAINKIKNIKIAGLSPFSGLQTISVPEIPQLAEGGFPKSGQLFIAREAGAEMVGNIGGRTAVANNDQIVSGIYEGVKAAMRDAINNSDNGNQFVVKVYLDGREITSAVSSQKRANGYVFAK